MTRAILLFCLFALLTLSFVPLPTLAITAAEECGQAGSGVPNPTRFCTLKDLFIAVMKLFLAGLAFIGTFMFMYGGFLFLTSAGMSDRIERAKETLFWSSIGILIALGSWLLVQTLLNIGTQGTFGGR
jgi:hypothetical protein